MEKELIKSLYLVSVSKTEEMDNNGDYDGRDYDYEQGYQDALTDLYRMSYNEYLGDIRN